MRRPMGALLATLMLLAAFPAVVAAAPPSNDDRSTPTVVTEPLPYTDALDTSEATADPSDGGCGARRTSPQSGTAIRPPSRRPTSQPGRGAIT